MECFKVYANEIEGRIDPFYYRPEFVQFYLQLEKTKFEIKSISEIAEKVTSGATPLSKGDAYTSKEEGIPFIRSGDINEDKNINFDEVLYIKDNIHNKLLKGSKLKKGDVLIAIVGATIGQVSIYNYDKEANINQAIALVRLKQGINPEYVKAFMISTLGQKQLDRIKRPVARANINLDEIRSIKIILPSLAIQNKIVSLMEDAYKTKKDKEAEAQQLLDSIDDYVLDELGIKLPELKDKMTYVVWSEEVENNRIDAYYYQPKFEEVEKAIERGKFEVKELKEFIKISNELENINNYESINYIDLASINKDLGSIQEIRQISSKEAPSRARQKLENGDLLISGLSGSLKSIAVVDKSELNFIASTGFYIIKNSENYDNYYLWALFRSPMYQSLLNRETTGAIMSSINREALLSLKIPLPPLEIQNKIAEEVKVRMQKAKRLQEEAKSILEEAKEKVERIILGEEEI